jgi:hypothetical protein
LKNTGIKEDTEMKVNVWYDDPGKEYIVLTLVIPCDQKRMQETLHELQEPRPEDLHMHYRIHDVRGSDECGREPEVDVIVRSNEEKIGRIITMLENIERNQWARAHYDDKVAAEAAKKAYDEAHKNGINKQSV